MNYRVKYATSVDSAFFFHILRSVLAYLTNQLNKVEEATQPLSRLGKSCFSKKANNYLCLRQMKLSFNQSSATPP